MQQKKVIREIVATGTDTSKVKQLLVKRLQFQFDLAEKIKEIHKKTHITHDMIASAGKELQNQPKYADNKSVREIKFGRDFLRDFRNRHGFMYG